MPEDIAQDSDMPDPTQGLIRVDVAVTDKFGKPVIGLLEKDFTLFDNNEQQKIVSFRAFNGGIQPATSLEVVLVINELNLPPNVRIGKMKLSAADREAETFLRSHGGVLDHPTRIYRLTDRGLFASPNTSVDGNELADEIEQRGPERRIWSPSEIATAIGKSASRQDVLNSLVALGSIAIEERRRPGRKLMFWIGNGWELEARRGTWFYDFSIELLTRMREARISLWGSSEWLLFDISGNPMPVNYHVDNESLNGPRSDSLSLPLIAARSGGGMLDTSDKLFAPIGERVEEESRYYSITFDPSRTNIIDEYHHLQLEVAKADTTAHTFQDYYDEPDFYDQPPVKKPLTVRELETLVANAHDVFRSEITHQLDGMQLTERLSSSKLASLEKKVHGSDAREVLKALGDESVFLPPPADEVLSTPPPDMATQRQILSNTISYINTIIPRFPDFSASRTTVQYQELPPKPNQTWKTATGDGSLHQGETETASIRFHDGKERVENKSITGGSSPQLGVGVSTVEHELMMDSLPRPS